MKIKEFIEHVQPYYGKHFKVAFDYDAEDGLSGIEYLCFYKGKVQLASYGKRVGEIGYERKIELKDPGLYSLDHLMDVIGVYKCDELELGIELSDVDGIAVLESCHEKVIILTTEKYKLKELAVQPLYLTAAEICQTVTWLVGDYSVRLKWQSARHVLKKSQAQA